MVQLLPKKRFQYDQCRLIILFHKWRDQHRNRLVILGGWLSPLYIVNLNAIYIENQSLFFFLLRYGIKCFWGRRSRVYKLLLFSQVHHFYPGINGCCLRPHGQCWKTSVASTAWIRLGSFICPAGCQDSSVLLKERMVLSSLPSSSCPPDKK